ncbi:MAG TPA: extracellular solute-binding protein [Verrucomicrobiae bacterium]|nr:extracellular solute-binding protein [Verrucomicrobiae bacterium]
MRARYIVVVLWIVVGVHGGFLLSPSPALSQTGAPAEWERILAAAKQEGKIVAGIPASADLRKQIEAVFKAKFPGIEVELSPSRGPQNVRKIAEEYKAGIHNSDLSIGGTDTMLYGFVEPGIAEPFEPFMVLPEVKDPKQWWGGHIWGDNKTGKRLIYSFEAFTSDNLWHNTELVKPEEIRSYDDLLQPKWKGKIGLLDPRNPGAGHSTWTFFWMIKGEEYLKKLVQQDLLISTNQRLLGEGLAKGKISLTIGISYYTLEPFIKAGLPVRALPVPKEGTYTSNGSGTVTIVKNPPHPNATKVFINWLLSKEGQETFGKAIGQATRRLDVDTKSLKAIGVYAAKDSLSIESYYKLQNHLEDAINQYRRPAMEIARQLIR